MHQPRLILFAKAPIPGYAKTRLIPALGAAGAARFHQHLVEYSLRTLCGAGTRVELHYSEAHPLFWRLARRYGCRLYPQAAGNLGERMLAAMRRRPGAAIITGSDCPSISTAMVRRCMKELQRADLVTLPAEDGGYGLIGALEPQHCAVEAAFTGIPWGTSEVMACTRRALSRTGLVMRELDTIWDIDTPEDLARWRAL